MNQSMQKRLSHVRPPRVQITYDLEVGGAIVLKELPCIIGIIADLSGSVPYNRKIYSKRKFIYLDQDNFKEVFQSAKPMVEVPIAIGDKKDMVRILFDSIEDFKPINFLKQIPALFDLYDQKIQLNDLCTRISNNTAIFKIAKDILASPGQDYQKSLDDLKLNNLNYISKLFDLFYKLLNQQDHQEGPNHQEADPNHQEADPNHQEADPNHQDFINIKSPILFINAQIAHINNIISDCFDSILHNVHFQKLEGTWRGIRHLLVNSEVGQGLKLRVLNCTFDELNKDLTDALEFDQSMLFHKLYEEEYGSYGGTPYSYLVIDQYIERNQEHFEFLRKLSQVVSCAHIPTSISAAPSLFDLNSFEDISHIRDISKVFESPELIAFQGFRETDDSKYISMVAPRFMSRLPYGPDTNPMQSYRETINNHNDFTWSNSVYVYAERVAESFAETGWFSNMIGPMNGGKVDNLPVYVYKDMDGEKLIKCPTEVAITDRREKELSENGCISLCYCKGADYSSFFSSQSLNKTLHYDKDSANANATLSTRFQYMLNTSRFAHYICCMMRDRIGTFTSTKELDAYFNTWIAQYVLWNGEDFPELLHKYPLKEASIKIEEDLAKPGKYNAIIYIRPHYQMEELKVSLRLVARIPVIKG